MEGELFYKCLFDQNHLIHSKTVLTLSMPVFINKHESSLCFRTFRTSLVIIYFLHTVFILQICESSTSAVEKCLILLVLSWTINVLPQFVIV